MIYYISDLHFFCKSQTNEGSVNYDNRPFATIAEMHEHMLRKWNERLPMEIPFISWAILH